MKERKRNQKSLISFFVLLSVVLLLVFGFHILINYFLGKDLFSNRIIESYFINFSLGFASFVVLILSLKKYVSSLGFIFMYTSFSKFVVFYIVFKANYSSNGNVDIAEFLTIMIPYAFTLTSEIYSMSKVLNK